MNDTLKECPLAELIAMLETTVVEDGCSIFNHSAEELGLALMDCHAEVLVALRATLPDDVRRLVIAARVVAFEDQGAEALRELDQASEAFADRVPWDDEPEAIASWNARKSPRTEMGDARFYIDCEFDGHGGPLLSFGIVAENGRGAHITVTDYPAVQDQWVVDNVVSVMASIPSERNIDLPLLAVGPFLKLFIGDAQSPVIVADSPVDIGRFCAAISTGADGGWAIADYPAMRFEVRNVDCYPTDLPGAVQHNALWDAMALRHALRTGEATDV